jgi:hypothetical protein
MAHTASIPSKRILKSKGRHDDVVAAQSTDRDYLLSCVGLQRSPPPKVGL